MDVSFLPTVNALLNASAATLLVLGRHFVRRGRIDAHRRTMLLAFAVSTLFLACYVGHKVGRGFENTAYGGEGAALLFYRVVLATHVPLAAAVPFLAMFLIRRGLAGRIADHRRLARWAWPVWIYVSITGVLIYLMLYVWNPAPVAPGAG